MSSSDQAAEREVGTKRLRGSEEDGPHEYDVVLGGDAFVDVDQLFQHPRFKGFFSKRYKRSAKRFIEEEDLNVIIVSKINVEKGEMMLKTSYSQKHDVRLAKKDDRINRVIGVAKKNSLPIAPPLITDTDLAFFVDKDGTRHQVEMRGERTMEGIFFKAKDVGRVFASGDFVKTIQRADTSYRKSDDWVELLKGEILPFEQYTAIGQNSANPTPDDHHSQRSTSSKEVFLTFDGLMHALHCTRTETAREFRDWVYQQVFAIAYGTAAQKKKMVSTLCRADKSFLQAFMQLVPNDLACIYLVDTMIREGNAKVYKFGRSGTIKKRFYDHSNAFGPNTLLDTVIFVPVDMLSTAEKRLKDSIMKENRYRLNKAKELVIMGAENRKAVRVIMKTISECYNGSMAIASSQHEKEMDDLTTMYEMHIKDSANSYELRIKDLERIIAVFEERFRNEELRIENAQLKERLRQTNSETN